MFRFRRFTVWLLFWVFSIWKVKGLGLRTRSLGLGGVLGAPHGEPSLSPENHPFPPLL